MKKVLIADDEPSLRWLVQTTIASADYVISEAADGAEAWELARLCPFGKIGAGTTLGASRDARRVFRCRISG